MAVSYVGASGTTVTNAWTFGTTTATATLPSGAAVGDRIYAFVANGPPTVTPATPAGWMTAGSFQVGTTANFASAAGPRRVSVFYRDRDTAWTMPAFTTSGTGSVIGVMTAAVRKNTDEAWSDLAVTAGSDTSTGTAIDVTAATNLNLTTGDLLFAFAVTSDNVTVTSPILSAAGATISSVTERSDSGTTSGNDLGVSVYTGAVTGGASTAGPRHRLTASSSTDGGVFFVRVRTQPALPPTGTASGAWNLTGNATGRRAPKATATGAWQVTGSATGRRTPRASVTGTWTLTGATTGARPSRAAANGTWIYDGAAVARRAATGAAIGSWGHEGEATGEHTPTATATSTWSFTGSAAGSRTPRASTSDTWTYTGDASGQAPDIEPVIGVAADSWEFAVAAVDTTTETPAAETPDDNATIQPFTITSHRGARNMSRWVAGGNGGGGLTAEEIVADPTVGAAFAPLAVNGKQTVRKDELVISVKDYGATGNGTTDDTAAIQAAVDAAPNGGTVLFPPGIYRLTATLNVTKPLALCALGGPVQIRQDTANTRGILVTASRVTVSGLRITGPQFAASQTSGRGIEFRGASAAAPISKAAVVDCEIDSWGGQGMWFQYTNDVTVRGVDIHDTWNSSIVTISCLRGRITGSGIANVTGTGFVYGIAITQLDSDTDPQSADWTVDNNNLRQLPWEAIDTHGGHRITITGNTITNSHRGIALVPAFNAAGSPVFAPRDCTISGNTIDSGRTDGAAAEGIIVSGGGLTAGSVLAPATATITGNVVRGHGTEITSTSAGIYIINSVGLTCSSNVIIEPGYNGICFHYNNNGYTCAGNTIVDAWSAAGGAVGIHVRSTHNTGTVSGNQLVRGSKTAGVVNVDGLRVFNADASISTTLGVNRFTLATNPVRDAGAGSRVGFFGSSAARAANPGTAAGADAAVLNAVVTALRNVGLVT